MKFIVLYMMLMVSSLACSAQTIADTLASDFNVLMERNFSHNNTVNVSWEMKGAHDYKFKTGDNVMEKSRKRDLHTIKASAMLPVLKQGRFSLYGNLQYTGYLLNTSIPSSVFQQDNYNMYQGGLTASYFTRLFGRPLYLLADVAADGWDKGFGLVQGRMVATMIFTRRKDTRITAGLAGMTLGRVPVVPVFTYWHRLANPAWSVDIALPSQFYLRRQGHRHRLSIGGQMSVDNFYLRTSVEGLPSVCRYSEVGINTEVLYEYIISNHFYVSARGGLSVPIKGALYTKSRRKLELAGEEVEQHRSAVPFVRVGLSYSLFK